MSSEQPIRAIETEYNGYKFRSRLEARWAVFFDAAGIKYEYETEGVELRDRNKYLPDFYLPEFDTHVEVKGKRPGYEQEILRIPEFIVWGGPIKQVVILTDIPGKTPDGGIWHFPIYYFSLDTVAGNRCVLPGWFFFFDSYNPETQVESVRGKISNANFKAPQLYKLDETFSIDPQSDYTLKNKCTEPSAWDANPLTAEALKRARQARFEHGETPTSAPIISAKSYSVQPVLIEPVHDIQKIPEDTPCKPATDAVAVKYNNHVFNNVLEACWSVFFDRLNIRHEYLEESVALDLIPYGYTNYQQYMPSFYLPDHDIWLNVFLDKCLANMSDIDNFNAHLSTNSTLFFAFDLPTYDYGKAYQFKRKKGLYTGRSVSVYYYSRCVKESYDTLILGKEKQSPFEQVVWKIPNITDSKMRKAIDAARHAEFDVWTC